MKHIRPEEIVLSLNKVQVTTDLRSRTAYLTIPMPKALIKDALRRLKLAKEGSAFGGAPENDCCNNVLSNIWNMNLKLEDLDAYILLLERALETSVTPIK